MQAQPSVSPRSRAGDGGALLRGEALTPLVHVGTSEMPGRLGRRRADAWAGPKRTGSHLARQAEWLRRQAAERGWRARCSPGRGMCKSRSLALPQTPCASRPCSGSSSVQFARVIFVVSSHSTFRSTVNLKLSFKMSLKTKHLKKKKEKNEKSLAHLLSVNRTCSCEQDESSRVPPVYLQPLRCPAQDGRRKTDSMAQLLWRGHQLWEEGECIHMVEVMDSTPSYSQLFHGQGPLMFGWTCGCHE